VTEDFYSFIMVTIDVILKEWLQVLWAYHCIGHFLGFLASLSLVCSATDGYGAEAIAWSVGISSVGMAKAALEVVNGVNLFGKHGAHWSVIFVDIDAHYRNRTTVDSILARESASKVVRRHNCAALRLVGQIAGTRWWLVVGLWLASLRRISVAYLISIIVATAPGRVSVTTLEITCGEMGVCE